MYLFIFIIFMMFAEIVNDQTMKSMTSVWTLHYLFYNDSCTKVRFYANVMTTEKLACPRKCNTANTLLSNMYIFGRRKLYDCRQIAWLSRRKSLPLCWQVQKNYYKTAISDYCILVWLLWNCQFSIFNTFLGEECILRDS